MWTFLALTTLSPTRHLCDDLRWHICSLTHARQCRRCGRGLSLSGRVSLCFLGRPDGLSESLCFACRHRAKWPSVA